MKLYQPYISTLMIVLLTAAITFVYPATVHGQCEVAQFENPDGQAGNAFAAVGVSGDVLVVGDPLAFGTLGAAYVFRRGPDGPQDWSLDATLMAPEPVTDDVFAARVAVNGDILVVSAHNADAPKFNSGAAYVYRYDSDIGEWVFETMLTASDGDLSDKFGFSVDVDGDVILIGARDDENKGVTKSGSAYVFRYDPDTSGWLEEAKLNDPNAEELDLFGRSVAISGDVALIGVPGNHDAGSGTGAAFIFRHDPKSPGQWIMQQQLQAFDVQWQAWFGWNVSLSGDVAVIGAPEDDGQTGAAYVMRFDGKSWVHEAKLVATNPVGPFPLMGSSTSISDDQSAILVGAPLDNEAGNEAGAAHLFRTDGKNWSEIAKLTASDAGSADDFGTTVGLSGDIAFVAAQRGSEQPGKVYAFAGASDSDCNNNGEADACDIFNGQSSDLNSNNVPDECDADLDGDGSVGVTDLLILLGNWGPCRNCKIPGECSADLDGDCTVGVIDLLMLLGHWG